ncbi:MAG: hypothetical protein IPH71_05820 [Proteobacteria bacterium]|nr:hypothetical protein [Pseudomonadota bacterium]
MPSRDGAALTLLAQYHFGDADGAFVPCVGAGLNLTLFGSRTAWPVARTSASRAWAWPGRSARTSRCRVPGR